MTRYFLAVLLVVSVKGFAQCPASSSTEKLDVKKLVTSLNGDNWTDTRDKLFSSPQLATKELVQALKATKPGTFTDEEVGTTVWQMRTLQALTGIKFHAPTKEILDENTINFLDYDQDGELYFYGNWMSRGVDYVAPHDVQLKIIEQWKAWLPSNLETHTYICSDSWDYYFG